MMITRRRVCFLVGVGELGLNVCHDLTPLWGGRGGEGGRAGGREGKTWN